MYDRDSLDQDFRRVHGDPTTTDTVLAAKRERGLRFIIEANPGQSLDEVEAVFAAIHPQFEVEPLFPATTFDPVAAGAQPPFSLYLSGHVATLPGLAMEDLGQDMLDIAAEARTQGDFVNVAADIAIENLCPDTVEEIDDVEASGIGSAWALMQMKVPQAWEAAGGNRGRGVSIGHPDTGWSDHAEWDHGGLDISRQRNFIPNEEPNDARDRFTQGGTLQPGHGTHTAGVMVCRGSVSNGRTAAPGLVTGVAPDAVNLPLRAITSVILFPGQVEVARAIVYAVQQRCRVISLSLGGVLGGHLGAPALAGAIEYAVRQNCIVVAASGNYPDFIPPGLRFTVEPASWANVVGVAGSTREDKPWESCGRVPYGSVTIAAPSHEVPMTIAVPPGTNRHRYGLGSGTSYATALIAGVAALWLSHHFNGEYRGPGTAQEMFIAHLRRTARKPADWNTWFGPGIVDAHRMIAERPLLLDVPVEPARAVS
ncbi:serine protease, subtilase family protein [Enhygromyxa salina]|uniref:Serine protease, subtilase family protein n=1 Tax=Enhygromyxa salina TaxID=215803 RepID=A0A0C2D0X3_9BACT|nr:S8/S53 family peptidase [Enhygromyxa salina]KIG15495.1 serine protease, subtilase family protein [Enhygromyxa salina]